MNIIHLESSPGWGGQEMRILKESIGMRNKGHNVIIVVEKSGKLVIQARKEKFKTYEVRYKKIFWCITFFKLLFIFLRHNIDIVNTHSSCDSWLGGLIARLLKKKIIRTRHLSTNIRPGINSVLLYNKLADYIVTTSSSIIPMICKQAKINKNNCACIATGIEPSSINASSEEINNFKKRFKINDKDFLIGTACFMRSWKGIDDFIKTANLFRDNKSIKWLIIGGGHSEKYKKMAKELNLDNLIFTDHIDNPYPAIASLDIFMLLSTAHEGVSQASLQAAYLEKPLITTSTGGLCEVCLDGITGLQVPIFSPNKVKEAVIKLYNDKEYRDNLAKSAKTHVVENFLYEKMLNDMEGIYFRLMNR